MTRRSTHSTNDGFTLVEMLSVIAIISILATVAMASLSGARKEARINTAVSAMESARSSVTLCTFRRTALSNPNGSSGGGAMCSGNERWPVLPAGWSYGNGSNDTAVGSFTFSASSASDGVTVTCTQADMTSASSCVRT